MVSLASLDGPGNLEPILDRNPPDDDELGDVPYDPYDVPGDVPEELVFDVVDILLELDTMKVPYMLGASAMIVKIDTCCCCCC